MYYFLTRRGEETNLTSDPIVETRICTTNQQADNRELSKGKKLRLSGGEVAVREGE